MNRGAPRARKARPIQPRDRVVYRDGSTIGNGTVLSRSGDTLHVSWDLHNPRIPSTLPEYRVARIGNEPR